MLCSTFRTEAQKKEGGTDEDAEEDAVGEDGKPIYREDGKVLKGPNYKPPNLYDCVHHEEVLEKLKKIEANSYNTDREQVQQLSLFDEDSAVTGK